MIRHPFYILLCLGTVGYLATADVRGWSLLHSLTKPIMTRTAMRGGSFNHK